MTTYILIIWLAAHCNGRNQDCANDNGSIVAQEFNDHRACSVALLKIKETSMLKFSNPYQPTISGVCVAKSSKGSR